MRRVLILGLGVSGEAAGALLRKTGARVTVVDASAGREVAERARRMQSLGVEVRTGTEELPDEPYDLAVASPGIPPNHPWFRTLRERGVGVISELELGASYCRCPLVAITGTNGKSTLTQLCASAIRHSGFRVEVAGNIGVPLSRLALESSRLDWLVVEVSSFQLEWIRAFHPRVGILLNIQPDHLDWHGDMAAYRRAKARLFENMVGGDRGVVPASLAAWIRREAAGRPEWVTFGTEPSADYRYAPGRILCRSGRDATPCLEIGACPFDNPVLGGAVAAAAAALLPGGIASPEGLEKALKTFAFLPHRLEAVATIGGVRFVNDSKATNLSAVRAALDMTSGPVRLIAGGLLKEKNLDLLQESLVKRVRAVYSIGKASEAIVSAWGKWVPCRVCGTLERAVRAAWREASPGETILLSPGGASFDQFRDYKERGFQFIQQVRAIDEET